MDYCSLEDAWGVKSFQTNLPDVPPPAREKQDVEPQDWPVSGPYGYRPQQYKPASNLNPVAAAYLYGGTDSILQALPQQAIEDLRSRLQANNFNVLAAALCFGFAIIILRDVLLKRH